MKALILAHGDDLAARRVAHALRMRHPEGTVVEAAMHDLVNAPRIAHRLGAAGVQTSVVLRSGERFTGDDVDVVFNRLRFVQAARFLRSPAAEQEYAAAETHALLVSWLTSLRCPVINPATATGLSGPTRHPFEWYRLAAAAGLATPAVHATSSPRRFPKERLARLDHQTLPANEPGWYGPAFTGRCASALVAGDDVIGDLPNELVPRVRRLARAAGLSLARCDFAEPADAPGEWVFAGVDERPDLAAEEELAGVVGMLEAAAGAAVFEATP